MTALAFRALAFAERYGVTIAVVGGDRLSWQSRGPTPGRALEALKAAKGELIDLLVRYRLDSAGGLAGDDLLAALQVAGFAVRRYGVNAALDDALGSALDRVPTSLLYAFADKQAEYSLALRALGAPDCLEGNARAVREETAAIGGRRTRRTKSDLPPCGQRVARPPARSRLPGLPRPGRALSHRHDRLAARSVQIHLADARLRGPQRRPRRRSGDARSKGGFDMSTTP